MARKVRGSIIYQVKSRFRELEAFGKSKPKGSDKIHSYGTMKTYLNHSLQFAEYCRNNYNCKNLEDCKPYIKEYIEGNDYSSWVKKVQRSAIAKMYGVSAEELGNIDTGKCLRSDVKRSRGKAKRDKHFSETGKYKDYVTFCKATGLRKSEVEALRGTAFYVDENGKKFLKVTDGTKGGRIRDVPILEEYANLVEKVCLKAGKGLVIPYIAADRLKAPSGADTHSYRANYARALYDKLKRPIEEIPQGEKYFCRGDLKGIIYDKEAMRIVSEALGHSRINIIAKSYLHGGN